MVLESGEQLAFSHETVLLEEAVSALLWESDGCYIDATYGRGGHSRLLLSRLGAQGKVWAIDKDPQAIQDGQNLAQTDARFSIEHGSFTTLGAAQPASIAGVLMDLGVSSVQLDDAKRGFSYRFDGPLDMRMDNSQGQTLGRWLAGASVQEMKGVIYDYGEERYALQIAKAIAARRETGGDITGTAELAQIVAGAVKTREPGKNPATRTFQAFRIHLNAELADLQQALQLSLKVLKPGGKLVVISFHSLEDRIVKRFIAEHARQEYDRRNPFAPDKLLPLQALARIKPGAAEIARNPRSRSAVMRVAQRTQVAWV